LAPALVELSFDDGLELVPMTFAEAVEDRADFAGFAARADEFDFADFVPDFPAALVDAFLVLAFATE
jgi:hypothetical protein